MSHLHLTLILALLALTPAHADELPGADKARYCISCHGENGLKSAPTQPAIGGRSAADLIVLLDEYRHLRRFNPAMQMLLVGMNDTDLADIADYFAIAGMDEGAVR